MEKKNKIMYIKTFEEFKLDNSNAQIKAQEYLKSISDMLNTMNINDIKKNKSEYGNYYLSVGNWNISNIPNTDGDNETSTEFETEFTNEEEKITLVINNTIYVDFYQTSGETQEHPAEYDDRGSVEVESIVMYDEEGDEFFIKTNPEIQEYSENIINNIIDK